MSDILPPCDLPNIGFGALPLTVAAASVAVAGIAAVLSSRHRGLSALTVTALALGVLGIATPQRASASGPPDCRVVLPNFAEVPEFDLVVIAPGSTIPDDVDTVIAEPTVTDLVPLETPVTTSSP